VTRQFKRTLDESTLNAMGKATRLCRREREVTPWRLMVSLIEAFASTTVDSIADVQRTFNALCETHVQYKPFHNQLAKAGFPEFTCATLCRLLDELACNVLRWSPQSPFARFGHIRIQDGTSLALKSTLADTWPGRFSTVSPAAVELHVEFDLMSEMVNRVDLTRDSASERASLPVAQELAGELFLADRGYFGAPYLQSLDTAGAFFIVRGKSNMNPLILKAVGPDGCEVERSCNQRLKQVKHLLAKYDCLDLTVRFTGKELDKQQLEARIEVHPNLRSDETPRYLVTNLDAEDFSPEQVSDGYRLRWQVELLFKEWKSHANLHAFDTGKSNIAEGLIWASLCAATITRYCAHMTQRIRRIAMSTRTVAKCFHHVLRDVLYDLMHPPENLLQSVERAIDYLAANSWRAHPKRDRRTGRIKSGLEYAYCRAQEPTYDGLQVLAGPKSNWA
jgi:hypothetical protein